MFNTKTPMTMAHATTTPATLVARDLNFALIAYNGRYFLWSGQSCWFAYDREDYAMADFHAHRNGNASHSFWGRTNGWTNAELEACAPLATPETGE